MGPRIDEIQQWYFLANIKRDVTTLKDSSRCLRNYRLNLGKTKCLLTIRWWPVQKEVNTSNYPFLVRSSKNIYQSIIGFFRFSIPQQEFPHQIYQYRRLAHFVDQHFPLVLR